MSRPSGAKFPARAWAESIASLVARRASWQPCAPGCYRRDFPTVAPRGQNNKLQVFVEENGPSDATIRERIKTSVASATVGRGPRSFPGNHFTKVEQTPQWIALLELMGLFKPAVKLWLADFDESDVGDAIVAPVCPPIAPESREELY